MDIEIDDTAERNLASLQGLPANPNPSSLMRDAAKALRVWIDSNPYSLRNPEHLTVKLTPQIAGPVPNTAWRAERFIIELDRIAVEIQRLKLACHCGAYES
jgi:hypothetical protein